MYKIVQVEDKDEKKKITREILESLEDWFGIPESREEYIENGSSELFWCAYDESKVVGFIYLHKTGKDTIELYVIGVLKEYHRRGIGKALFECAKKAIKESGYSFMQVKTVKMGKCQEYDNTNKFYLSIGFKEFEVFPTLWDEWNPCQVYIMAL